MLSRSALVALLVVASPALSQSPPAGAGAAPAKKVRKVRPQQLGNPKDDEPAVTPKASEAPKCAPCLGSDADSALANGLLHAFEPSPDEIRIIAVEDLGLLGDRRALNALAQLIFDGSPRVQLAAVRSVSVFRHRRAEEILSNVVRHPRLPELVKIRAVEALPFQLTTSAQKFLEGVADHPRYPPGVKSAARRALPPAAAAPGPPSAG